MGCGASSSSEGVTTSRFQTPDQQEREERRQEVLEKYKLSDKDRARILTYPVFKVPTKFMVNEHIIEFVFFGVKDETCTEVTIFFQDKEHETDIVERRGMNFSMVKSDDRQRYCKVSFNHSWSADECWDNPSNDETHMHTEPIESFAQEEHAKPGDPQVKVARPVIFINTATHLLGSQNNNTDLECSTISDYKMYSGTAKQATEILWRASESANPEKKEVSALAQLIPVRTTHAPNKPVKKPA
eukprot:TRINITY_DN83_c0_g1_i1.p1 TRINITY_DN83_c0_g1~~TRINITY_DN83_c0_g1_i1.p1  ORF type:complete len:261 (-),score=67.86 TRINITY_DN83_c0_g1_i1:99-827(-)